MPSRTLKKFHTSAAAQLKVFDENVEEIGATILHSPRTPTEIRRRQTKNFPFHKCQHHQQCLQEEMEGDALHNYKWDIIGLSETHSKSVARLQQKKDMAFG